MDIYSLLKKEHNSLREMLSQMIRKGGIEKEMFFEFRRELEAHMEGEEQFLYPELENNSHTRMMALKAYAEHDTGRFLIRRISSEKNLEAWQANIQVLDEVLEHHMKEEEKRVFSASKDILGKSKDEEILNEYNQFKAEEKSLV